MSRTWLFVTFQPIWAAFQLATHLRIGLTCLVSGRFDAKPPSALTHLSFALNTRAAGVPDEELRRKLSQSMNR